jgi:hypothetical protein
MLPFDNVCTRLQSSPNEVGQHPSAMDVISRLRRERIQSKWWKCVSQFELGLMDQLIYDALFTCVRFLERAGAVADFDLQPRYIPHHV